MTIFDELMHFLDSNGFKVDQNDDERLACVKDAGENFRQEIAFSYFSRSKDRIVGSLRVYLHLPICTESLGRKEFADGITVEFSPSGIFQVGCGRTEGWLTKDVDSIQKSIINVAIPWLVSLSDAKSMIVYIESILNGKNPDEEPQREPSDKGLFSKLIFRQTAPSNSAQQLRKPPVYKEYLANLYFMTGDIDTSVNYMKEWVSFNNSMPIVKPYIEKLEVYLTRNSRKPTR